MNILATVAAMVFLVLSIAMLIVCVVFSITNKDWYFERSPYTGICYEVHEFTFPFAHGRGMNPVDISYCEEDE